MFSSLCTRLSIAIRAFLQALTLIVACPVRPVASPSNLDSRASGVQHLGQTDTTPHRPRTIVHNRNSNANSTQAAEFWQISTGVVSGSLDEAGQLKGGNFALRTSVALSSESFYQAQKGTIDSDHGIDKNVLAAAGQALGKDFPTVIELLTELVDNGDGAAQEDSRSVLGR